MVLAMLLFSDERVFEFDQSKKSILFFAFFDSIWGKIRQVYPPKNFLSPISLKVRKIIVLVDLF